MNISDFVANLLVNIVVSTNTKMAKIKNYNLHCEISPGNFPVFVLQARQMRKIVTSVSGRSIFSQQEQRSTLPFQGTPGRWPSGRPAPQG